MTKILRSTMNGRRLRGSLPFLMIGISLLLTGCAARKKAWEKNLIREEITVRGIKGEYDLLFLTDSHVVVEDVHASEKERDYLAARQPTFYNEEGISSQEQFEEWMEYADEEEVDAVLLGGDIIDCPTQSSLEYLDEQLASLNMPFVYTLGNHDWTFPWEYMTEKGKKEYRPLFERYTEGNTDFHAHDFGEFIVAAVDNSAGRVSRDAVEDYDEVLKQGKPVIVLAHMPFLTQSVLTRAREIWDGGVVIGGGNYGGIYPDEATAEFMQMTTADDSPVVLVLAGHVHFYDMDVIEGEKDVPQIVGAAGFQGSAVRVTIKG